jgi:hypothetical protein
MPKDIGQELCFIEQSRMLMHSVGTIPTSLVEAHSKKAQSACLQACTPYVLNYVGSCYCITKLPMFFIEQKLTLAVQANYVTRAPAPSAIFSGGQPWAGMESTFVISCIFVLQAWDGVFSL